MRAGVRMLSVVDSRARIPSLGRARPGDDDTDRSHRRPAFRWMAGLWRACPTGTSDPGHGCVAVPLGESPARSSFATATRVTIVLPSSWASLGSSLLTRPRTRLSRASSWDCASACAEQILWLVAGSTMRSCGRPVTWRFRHVPFRRQPLPSCMLSTYRWRVRRAWDPTRRC